MAPQEGHRMKYPERIYFKSSGISRKKLTMIENKKIIYYNQKHGKVERRLDCRKGGITSVQNRGEKG